MLFDYELVQKIKDAGYLNEFQKRVDNRFVKILSEGIFKGIKEDVVLQFSATPLNMEDITGNAGGGIVGWSFEGEAPVYSKLKDLGKSVYTPLPDVYKASQWAFAPAGVPIAMLTAWHAVQKIIKSKK